jgi:SAM-dependent methyltransferase
MRADRQLLGRTANRISRFGEERRIEFLLYNPLLFLHYHRMANADAPAVCRALVETFPDAQSWSDIGAGSGRYAAELAQNGRDVTAWERSRAGRLLGRWQKVATRPFDLTAGPDPLHGHRSDAAICLEVAEHLPSALGQSLVALLARTAPLVLFSAAAPGQAGHGHVNEQPRGYWIRQFGTHGMTADEEARESLVARFEQYEVGAWWIPQNISVFRMAASSGIQQ